MERHNSRNKHISGSLIQNSQNGAYQVKVHAQHYSSKDSKTKSLNEDMVRACWGPLGHSKGRQVAVEDKGTRTDKDKRDKGFVLQNFNLPPDTNAIISQN